MNKNHISELCKQLNLGSPTNEISPVTGGLLHLMWKLDTTKGSYAIKQLSKNIKLTAQIKKSYELTEKIADKFKQHGIPAISALEVKGQHLIEIDGTAYLVYPWVDAKALDKDAVSEKHALSISSLLAKMHLLNLNFSEIESPEFDIHSDKKIVRLINGSIACHCTFASSLKENQDRIIHINHSYQSAISLIKDHVVISHGDLDQKNVLWDQNDTPILIDWESARKLNPTYEIVNSALDWSGITTENFNKILFVKMINAYQIAGGIIDKKHLQAAFFGVLGNWLNWMVYNISRACNSSDSEQQKIGTEQVEQVIPTIIRLKSLIPSLIAQIMEG
ncbi:MAG: phosphotransferase [Proteobacteria bacterium]|nr:phosphotransferase [Pseudomonadota bacterium]